jgi:hypothetical protein
MAKNKTILACLSNQDLSEVTSVGQRGCKSSLNRIGHRAV